MKKLMRKVFYVSLLLGIIIMNTGIFNGVTLQNKIRAIDNNIYIKPVQDGVIEKWNITSNRYLNNIYTSITDNTLYLNVDLSRFVVNYGTQIELPNGVILKGFKTSASNNLYKFDLTAQGYTAESLYGANISIKTVYPVTSGASPIHAAGTISINKGDYYQANYETYGQSIYNLFTDSNFNTLVDGVNLDTIATIMDNAPLYPSPEKSRLQGLLSSASVIYYATAPASSDVCPVDGVDSGLPGNAISSANYTIPTIPTNNADYFNSQTTANPYGGNFKTYVSGNDVMLEMNAYGTWQGYWYAIVLPNGSEIKTRSTTGSNIDSKELFNLKDYGYTSSNINTEFVGNKIITKSYNNTNAGDSPHSAEPIDAYLSVPYYLDDYVTYGNAVYKLFSDNTLSALAYNLSQADINLVNIMAKPAGNTDEKTRLDELVVLAQSKYDAYSTTLNTACEALNDKLLNEDKNDILDGVNQGNITDVLNKISDLPDGDVKTILLADTTLAQNILNDRINAQNSISGLLNTDKDDLLDNVDVIDINVAQNYVDALPDNTIKAELQLDIDKANTLLSNQHDAINMVVNLLTENKDDLKVGVNQDTINTANIAVLQLPNNELKTALLSDIAIAQSLFNDRKDLLLLIDALLNNDKNDVLPGIDSGYIHNVRSDLDGLIDGEYKDSLFIEFSIAQDIVAAKDAVASIFMDDSKTALNPNISLHFFVFASSEVDKIPEGPRKISLYEDIDNAVKLSHNTSTLQDMIAGLFTDTNKLDLKESTTQAKITSLSNQVGDMVEGTLKDQLNEDLALAQKIYNAKYNTLALFTDSSKEDVIIDLNNDKISAAETDVNKLVDSQLRTDLLSDIVLAQGLLAKRELAIAIVANLFTDETKTDTTSVLNDFNLASATISVGVLPSSDLKTALLEDIILAETIHNTKQLVADIFTNTNKDVVVAGITLDDVTLIENEVKLLPEGQARNNLLADINTAKDIINLAITQLNDATDAVNNLFTDINKNDIKETTEQSTISDANALVTDLPSGIDKDNLLIGIEKAEAILAAYTSVDNIFVDENKTNTKPGTTVAAITLIEESVGLLPDGPAKDKLNEDLASAKEIVQAKLDYNDSLSEDIAALFTDINKIDINVSTNQDLIDVIREGLEAVDDHILKESFEADLVKAENILNAKIKTQSLFTDNTKLIINDSITSTMIEEVTTVINLLDDTALRAELLSNIDNATEQLANMELVIEMVLALYTDETKSDIKTTSDMDKINEVSLLVNGLSDSTTKINLSLDITKAYIIFSFKKEVADLFTTSNKDDVVPGVNLTDINSIEAKIIFNPSVQNKTDLLADLSIARTILETRMDAIDKVDALFTDSSKNDLVDTITSTDIDDIKLIVADLPDSTIKSTLTSHLKTAEDMLNANELVDALFTDSKDDINDSTKDIVIAEVLETVNDLVVGPEREALLVKIATAQALLNQRKDVSILVNSFFTDSNKNDTRLNLSPGLIITAKESYNQLPSSSFRDDLLKDINVAEAILIVKNEMRIIFTPDRQDLVEGVDADKLNELNDMITALPDGPAKYNLNVSLLKAMDILEYKNRLPINLRANETVLIEGLSYPVNTIITEQQFLSDASIKTNALTSLFALRLKSDVVITTDFNDVVKLNTLGSYSVTVSATNGYGDVETLNIKVNVIAVKEVIVNKPSKKPNTIIETGSNINLTLIITYLSTSISLIIITLRKKYLK